MLPIDAVLRLLLVEDRIEDAEQLTSLLRNGGMAVRPHRPESQDDLRRILATQALDLVLASHSARGIGFAKVLHEVETSGKDLPVLAVVDALDEALLLEVLDAGGRGLLLRRQPIQARAIVRAEIEAVQTRRSLRVLEAQLRESERRCDTLIASSRDPIAYLHEGMHLRANEAYLEMFGYASFGEVEGLSVLDLVIPSHADALKQVLKQTSRGETPPSTMEIKALDANGRPFDARLELTTANYEGEPCLQVVIRPQLVDSEMAAELEALRLRDPLTGLANRAHFMAELEKVVAAAAAGRHHQSLLLIEPDNFETLATELGIGQADALLKACCARLATCLDDKTLAGRLLDHRFGVICREHGHQATMARAERILRAFHESILDLGSRSLSLTVSISAVQIGERNAQLAPVLSRAESGLQSALGVGGNRIDLHDPAARDRAEEERIAAWMQRLREALANDGFTFYYQPLVSLAGADTTETYELYLRLKGSGGEIIPPATFLPLAQEHGLGPEIDRWVVEQAIHTIAECQAGGRKTTLYVKLDPKSLTANPGFGEFVASLVRKSGIPGQQLVLQLHEPSVFTHLKAVQAFSRAIHAVGVQLALEHFGTGLNSFQLLQHIDADVLKIDRSYIADLAKNVEHQSRVREFAAKAKELGKVSVAHYVQDATSMAVLYGMNVDYVEGDFIAPAGPAMNHDFS